MVTIESSHYFKAFSPIFRDVEMAGMDHSRSSLNGSGRCFSVGCIGPLQFLAASLFCGILSKSESREVRHRLHLKFLHNLLVTPKVFYVDGVNAVLATLVYFLGCGGDFSRNGQESSAYLPDVQAVLRSPSYRNTAFCDPRQPAQTYVFGQMK